MTLHILSTALWQMPVQWAVSAALESESLKPAVTMTAMMPAPNWPIPCMANTEPYQFVVSKLSQSLHEPTDLTIIAPRHLVVANSDVMMLESG